MKRISLIDAVREIIIQREPDGVEIIEKLGKPNWDFYDYNRPEREPARMAYERAVTFLKSLRPADIGAEGLHVGASCRHLVTSSEWNNQALSIWKSALLSEPGYPEVTGVNVDRAALEACLLSDAPQENAARPRRGAPNVANWDAIEELVRLECKKSGLPDPDGDKDWRYQADVERFIAAQIEQRNESAGESTIRRHARAIISKLGSEVLA